MMKFAKLFESKNLIYSAGAILFCLFFYVAGSAQSPINSPPHGELVYVPIYSSIFYENGKLTLELAATLSIHNINPDKQITVVRADYYDTAGKLVKHYLEKPLLLGALQTSNLVIERANTKGGTGANFLVEWKSDQSVASPLIEAVMVNASSNLGIAFTTSGKVVKQTSPATK